MEPLQTEEALEFSGDPGNEEGLDFDIDEGLGPLEDEDFSDDVTLERELGQSWRSGHPFREDA